MKKMKMKIIQNSKFINIILVFFERFVVVHDVVVVVVLFVII